MVVTACLTLQHLTVKSHSDLSVLTEPSVYIIIIRSWTVYFAVCCFHDQEAWSLNPACLLAIWQCLHSFTSFLAERSHRGARISLRAFPLPWLVLIWLIHPCLVLYCCLSCLSCFIKWVVGIFRSAEVHALTCSNFFLVCIAGRSTIQREPYGLRECIFGGSWRDSHCLILHWSSVFGLICDPVLRHSL